MSAHGTNHRVLVRQASGCVDALRTVRAQVANLQRIAELLPLDRQARQSRDAAAGILSHLDDALARLTPLVGRDGSAR